jgi:hypothetical protein
MTGEGFLRALASQMTDELRPSESIHRFTTNPDVLGAYAEASLRSFVLKVVFALRVCTGAVISEQLCSQPEKVPQIDTIIWAPSPAPAIYAAGDFGLVPRGGVFGIMEIKRSAYSGVGSNPAERLGDDRVFSLVADIGRRQHEAQLSSPDRDMYPVFPALGVVVLPKPKQYDTELDRLIQAGRAVVLFEYQDQDLVPNPLAIHRLVKFLAMTRQRARAMDGAEYVNLELLEGGPNIRMHLTGSGLCGGRPVTGVPTAGGDKVGKYHPSDENISR